MISGFTSDVRQEYVRKLESIGAIVSELANYDPCSTHLICPKPSRNEKIFSFIAAGKWILHNNYVDKSVENGKLLDVCIVK